MLRRNARLRREYIYRKSLEGKERTHFERKKLLRQALEGELGTSRGERGPSGADGNAGARTRKRFGGGLISFFLQRPEGKPIPTELRGDEAALREELALEDSVSGAAAGSSRAARDDEYARAGEADPKAGRGPSQLPPLSPSRRLIWPLYKVENQSIALPAGAPDHVARPVQPAHRLLQGAQAGHSQRPASEPRQPGKGRPGCPQNKQPVPRRVRLICSMPAPSLEPLKGDVGAGGRVPHRRLHRHRGGPRAPRRAGRHGAVPPAVWPHGVLWPGQRGAAARPQGALETFFHLNKLIFYCMATADASRVRPSSSGARAEMTNLFI